MCKPIHSFVSVIVLLFLACNTPDAGNTAINEKVIERHAKSNGKFTTGRVISISDGDTFKLLNSDNRTIRVRLHGVDAPERGQDYATQAKEKLSELIFSRSVEVEEKSTDRYGRVVGIVYADNKNINEELLRSGYVWHYTQYDKNNAWADLMKNAQKRKEGLWNKTNPTPPWQWRKQKREFSSTSIPR